MTGVRDPRADAQSRIPSDVEARVLEPSPPASTDPEWFADDPTDPGHGHALVTPIPGEGITWGELAASAPDIAAYASAHWLDGRRLLAPLPDAFVETRRSLHQVAYFIVAPMRHRATGKMGLRYTHLGFGTPSCAATTTSERGNRKSIIVGCDEDHVAAARDAGRASEFRPFASDPSMLEQV